MWRERERERERERDVVRGVISLMVMGRKEVNPTVRFQESMAYIDSFNSIMRFLKIK